MKNFLAAGIALGVLAVVLLNFYVSSTIESFQEDPGAVSLYRFITDAPANVDFTASLVKKVRLPEGYQASLEGAVKPDELALVLGKKLPKGAKVGQFLLWSTFRTDDSGRPDTLDNILPPGMRVIPIPVTKFSSAGGWIRPGDTVDLVGTFTNREKPGMPQYQSTWVFLERVKVVAVGGSTGYGAQQDSRRGIEYTDISVLVSAADALKVLYALEHASKISALLRNPGDTRTLKDPEKGINSFLFERLRPQALAESEGVVPSGAGWSQTPVTSWPVSSPLVVPAATGN